MQARIYKPTKSSMQSGIKNIENWVLEFIPEKKRFIEDIMGWTSSSEMQTEVILKFSSLENAESFAKANNINYEVEEPLERNIVKKSYESNFK